MAEDVVTNEDLPQLFRAADQASIAAQKQYIAGTLLRLLLMVVSALLGVAAWRVGASNVDVLGLASVVLFSFALMAEGFLWKWRPDKAWYDARAVAESAKTLAWRFAAKGEPFLDDTASEEAVARRLVERVTAVRQQYPGLELAPVEGKVVTDWMRELRKQSWPRRRCVYLAQRLEDQKGWYSRNARKDKRRSSQYRLALVVLEAIGLVASLLAAFFESFPLIAPAVAAAVGAVIAWMETKQHDFNARAYAAAVADLAQAQSRIELATSEKEFALELSNTEEAISREHTLWLASRTNL